MARTSKTASGATNHNDNMEVLAPVDAAIDSLNIDDFDLFEGGDDVVDVDGSDLLFDDLDFGVVDAIDDAIDDAIGDANGENVSLLDSSLTNDIQQEVGRKLGFTTTAPSGSASGGAGLPRTGGVRTSKGPPPIFKRKKGKSKKKTRNSNYNDADIHINHDDVNAINSSGGDNNNIYKNHHNNNDNQQDQDGTGSSGLPSRGRSKRKKKPIVMYTDSDDTTFTKDLKKQMTMNKLQKSNLTANGNAMYFSNNSMQPDTSSASHQYNSADLVGQSSSSPSSAAFRQSSSSLLLSSPRSNKKHKNNRSSTIMTSSANVFSTSPDQLTKRSSGISIGGGGGSSSTYTDQKRTGKMQRALPTQRKRKASATVGNNSSTVSMMGNTTTNATSFGMSLSSSSSLHKKSKTSSHHTNTSTMQSTKTTTGTTSSLPIPTTSSSKKKSSKTFFPFTSVPKSCLSGKRQRVFVNQPNLQKFYHSVRSSTSTTANGNNNVEKKKSGILAQLLTKHVFGSSPPSGHEKLTQALTKNTYRTVDEQSILFTKKMIKTINKKSLISELKQLQTDLHNQSRFMTKGMVHLGSWCNRKFANGGNTSTVSSSKKGSSLVLPSSTTTASSEKKPTTPPGGGPSFCSTIISSTKNQSSRNFILPEIINTVFIAPYPQQSKSKPMISLTVKIKCKHLKKQDTNRTTKASILKKSPIGLSFILSKPVPPSSSSLSLPVQPPPSIQSNNVAPVIQTQASVPSKKVKSKVSSLKWTDSSTVRKTLAPPSTAYGTNTSATISTSARNKSSAVKQLVKKTSAKLPQKTITKEKEYEEMNPKERLDHLKKILSQRAALAEKLMYKSRSTQGGEQRLRKRDEERHKLIQANDVHVYMNVMTLFGIMKNMPYWDDINPTNVSSALSLIRQPDISHREMYWSGDVIPVVSSVLEEHKEGNDQSKKQLVHGNKEAVDAEINTSSGVEEDKVSSSSLYDRLQSMLVDIGGESSNDENDSFDDNKSDFEESNIIDLDNDDENNGQESILDVSRLTLDQRAYIHLRSIHLIDQTFLPSCQPNVIEIDTENNDYIVEDQDQHDETKNGYNSIEDLIKKLKLDLYKQHQKTNNIATDLQQKADEEREHISCKLKKLDEDNHVILKHTQIVGKAKKKRESENKMKSRMNDSDKWVPW